MCFTFTVSLTCDFEYVEKTASPTSNVRRFLECKLIIQVLQIWRYSPFGCPKLILDVNGGASPDYCINDVIGKVASYVRVTS
jgi:hypothetical protein